MSSFCYVFVNMYTSGIHAGIQAAHAIAELVHNFQSSPILKGWVEETKTIILLEGGESGDLEQLAVLFADIDCEQETEKFIFNIWFEPGLNSAATALALIFTDEAMGEDQPQDIKNLVEIVRGRGLAR